MSTAIAAYGDRIASLFESSEKFIIIHSSSDDIKNLPSINIGNNSPNELLRLLKQNDVKILICGAISGCVQDLLEAHNIEVIPWITGDIESVIQAFYSENLISSSFMMPGYRKRGCNRRHRFHRRHKNYK